MSRNCPDKKSPKNKSITPRRDKKEKGKGKARAIETEKEDKSDDSSDDDTESSRSPSPPPYKAGSVAASVRKMTVKQKEEMIEELMDQGF